MKVLEITILNETGLHARPAKTLVNLAKGYKSEILVFNGSKRANAKSMVSVLTLGAVKGSLITVQVTGEDEDQALAEIKAAIEAGLGDAIHPAEGGLPTSAAQPVTAPPAPAITRAAAPARTAAQSQGYLRGISAAPGIAIGPVFQYHRPDASLDYAAQLPGDGQQHLAKAVGRAREQLAVLAQSMKDRKMAAEAGIFEAHIELLEDPELKDAVVERLKTGQNVVQAWHEVVEEQALVVAGLADATLSARADDLRDVGRRVLRLILGKEETTAPLPDTPVVIIAEDLSPSETAAFDPRRVLGFAIVNGGPTSHIAILAQALGLPAVVAAEAAVLDVPVGHPVILNGNEGSLIVDPAADVIERAREVQAAWLASRRSAFEQAGQPAITKDGHHVDVTGNIGSPADAEKALKNGADGVGLLRTEFLFLDRDTAPTEDEQFGVYQAIARIMAERPVIVRTLDIGGDKPLAYITMNPELNPFLGERGIRLCLNRPELFCEQLRAILRAAPYGNLRIMFPMVGDIEEIRQARQLVDDLSRQLVAPPVSIGIMVEVPSAALMADVLASEVDFFSIGTNDLTQYTLAVDRGHPALAAKHDGLHPSVLRLIAMTVEAAHKHGKRADICGELGSNAAAVPILVGLGIDELSVSIPAIPTVKAQVRGLELAEVQPLAQRALKCSTGSEVRELVKQYTSRQRVD